MKKFHVSESGEPGVCKAEIKCRFGGESGKENHFESIEEAQAFAEKRISEEFQGNLKSYTRDTPIEIDLPNSHGLFRVKDGDLDDIKSRLALSSGLCGDLALAIHNETGADPYFLCFSYYTEEELHEAFERDPESVFDATHVVVGSLHKPLHFIDSYGQKSMNELMEFWGEDISIIEGNKEMLEAYADKDMSSKLSNFAKSAIKLDKENKSYDYEEIDEYEDF